MGLLWFCVKPFCAVAPITRIMLLSFGCFFTTYFCVMAKQLFSFSLICCLLGKLKKCVVKKLLCGGWGAK